MLSVTNIERRREILKELKESGSARIDELAARLDVTRVTIRADVADLERRGLAVRSRGVVLAPERGELPRYVTNTIHEHREAKDAIARSAVKLLDPGSTVILDSGSTNAVLAGRLSDLPLTVITSSIPVILELADATEIDLIVSGGVLRKPSLAMVGEFARALYQHVHADIAFIGAGGYTLEHGPTGPNLLEAETKRLIIAAADTVCLLVDSSKLGKRLMAAICDWSRINYLVTDRMEPGLIDAFRDEGVEVILPE